MNTVANAFVLISQVIEHYRGVKYSPLQILSHYISALLNLLLP